ncbi:unnamed protein product [Parnassius apollo]|uniref:(apollo) hypothetical protein n=1 Tax=Parnassius apollo TaxID=110799 RepID=A0A8S3WIG8_PARAO|nr:unnamed protein product [Parnassius apollo]
MEPAPSTSHPFKEIVSPLKKRKMSHFSDSEKRSPLSEYLFLPWMGATLRGLVLRQAPTTGALLYTMFVANGNVNILFTTAFILLLLSELFIWLEIVRLVLMRWECGKQMKMSSEVNCEVQTLWSNDDVPSVEVRNYVY